jgi:hypothetical protein
MITLTRPQLEANTGVDPASIAAGLIATLAENMKLRPRQCIFRVLTLAAADLSIGTNGTDISPAKLTGMAAHLWSELSRTPELYEPLLTIAIDKDVGQVSFHIEIHRRHNAKIICGRYLAYKEMQKAARKIVLAREWQSDRTFKLVIVFAGNKHDDASYRKDQWELCLRLRELRLDK